MCYGEALSAAVVRARKRHQCSDCGRAIEPGRNYRRETGVFEGEFYAVKRCRTCASALAASIEETDHGCVYLSGDERAELRGEPWRETIKRLRKAWRALRGRQSDPAPSAET